MKTKAGRVLEAKFPGTCRSCGRRFDAGSLIVWSPVDRKARHYKCGVPSTISKNRPADWVERSPSQERGWYLPPLDPENNHVFGDTLPEPSTPTVEPQPVSERRQHDEQLRYRQSLRNRRNR